MKQKNTALRLKKLLVSLLCGAMFVGTATALSGCQSGGDPQETEPGTQPAAVVTEAPTAAPTEVPTAADTLSPEELAQMKEETMKRLYEQTAYVQLPIGGFSTPATDLRDHNTGVEGSYKAAWQTVADAGLNYMITLEEWSSPSWIVEAAEAAHAAGVKLYYQGLGDADRSIEWMNLILASEGAGAFAGVYLKDEPCFDDLSALGTATQKVRDAMTNQKYPVISNLLPTYAPEAAVSSDYRAYVHTYIQECKPEILMFDYYPFTGSDSTPAMIANNAVALLEANAAGIPLYTFVQSSGWNGMSDPTFCQMRLNAHINLAMGSKGLCYFVACEHYPNWNYSAMLKADGKTTKMYDNVKALNAEINVMKGVYLNFTCKGMMLVNYKNISRLLEKVKSEEFLLDSFGVLASAAPDGSGKFLVGCFENDRHEYGYYIVNLDYKKAASVTLTFTDTATDEYSLWSAAGVTDMGVLSPNGRLTVELDKGGAAFLYVSPSAK